MNKSKALFQALVDELGLSPEFVRAYYFHQELKKERKKHKVKGVRGFQPSYSWYHNHFTKYVNLLLKIFDVADRSRGFEDLPDVNIVRFAILLTHKLHRPASSLKAYVGQRARNRDDVDGLPLNRYAIAYVHRRLELLGEGDLNEEVFRKDLDALLSYQASEDLERAYYQTFKSTLGKHQVEDLDMTIDSFYYFLDSSVKSLLDAYDHHLDNELYIKAKAYSEKYSELLEKVFSLWSSILWTVDKEYDM